MWRVVTLRLLRQVRGASGAAVGRHGPAARISAGTLMSARRHFSSASAGQQKQHDASRAVDLEPEKQRCDAAVGVGVDGDVAERPPDLSNEVEAELQAAGAGAAVALAARLLSKNPRGWVSPRVWDFIAQDAWDKCADVVSRFAPQERTRSKSDGLAYADRVRVFPPHVRTNPTVSTALARHDNIALSIAMHVLATPKETAAVWSDGSVLAPVTVGRMFEAAARRGSQVARDLWYLYANQNEGIRLDGRVCTSAMFAFGVRRETDDVMNVLRAMKSGETEAEPVLLDGVVQALSSAQRPDLIVEVLRGTIPAKASVVVAILRSLKTSHRLDMASVIWDAVKNSHNMRWDPMSTTAAVQVLGEAGEFERMIQAYELGEMFLAENPQYSLSPAVTSNPRSLSAVIHALGRAGQPGKIAPVFQGAVSRGLVVDLGVYNSMLGAMALSGDLDGMDRVLEHVKKGGLTPDVFTMAACIKGFAFVGDVSNLLATWGWCLSQRVQVGRHLMVPLVRGLCLGGAFESARKVVDQAFVLGWKDGCEIVMVELLREHARRVGVVLPKPWRSRGSPQERERLSALESKKSTWIKADDCLPEGTNETADDATSSPGLPSSGEGGDDRDARAAVAGSADSAVATDDAEAASTGARSPRGLPGMLATAAPPTLSVDSRAWKELVLVWDMFSRYNMRRGVDAMVVMMDAHLLARMPETVLRIYAGIEAEGPTPDRHVFSRVFGAMKMMADMGMKNLPDRDFLRIYQYMKSLNIAPDLAMIDAMFRIGRRCGSTQDLIDLGADIERYKIVPDNNLWMTIMMTWGQRGCFKQASLVFDRCSHPTIQMAWRMVLHLFPLGQQWTVAEKLLRDLFGVSASKPFDSSQEAFMTSRERALWRSMLLSLKLEDAPDLVGEVLAPKVEDEATASGRNRARGDAGGAENVSADAAVASTAHADVEVSMVDNADNPGNGSKVVADNVEASWRQYEEVKRVGGMLRSRAYGTLLLDQAAAQEWGRVKKMIMDAARDSVPVPGAVVKAVLGYMVKKRQYASAASLFPVVFPRPQYGTALWFATQLPIKNGLRKAATDAVRDAFPHVSAGMYSVTMTSSDVGKLCSILRGLKIYDPWLPNKTSTPVAPVTKEKLRLPNKTGTPVAPVTGEKLRLPNKTGTPVAPVTKEKLRQPNKTSTPVAPVIEEKLRLPNKMGTPVAPVTEERLRQPNKTSTPVAPVSEEEKAARTSAVSDPNHRSELQTRLFHTLLVGAKWWEEYRAVRSSGVLEASLTPMSLAGLLRVAAPHARSADQIEELWKDALSVGVLPDYMCWNRRLEAYIRVKAWGCLVPFFEELPPMYFTRDLFSQLARVLGELPPPVKEAFQLIAPADGKSTGAPGQVSWADRRTWLRTLRVTPLANVTVRSHDYHRHIWNLGKYVRERASNAAKRKGMEPVK